MISLFTPNAFNTVLYDWIGSLLMLGTVWGWLYKRIEPIIDSRLRAVTFELSALDRFVQVSRSAAVLYVLVP